MTLSAVVRCLMVLGCVAVLNAIENDLVIPRGISGYPYFDIQGQPKIAYVATDDRASLLSGGKDPTTSRIFRNSGPDKSVRALRVKKDGLQRSWLVWEERSIGESGHVFLGRIAEGGLADIRSLSADLEGRHHAPDLDISPGGRMFAVWIQTRDAESRLILKSSSPERTWVVRSSCGDSLFTPRLLADAEGTIWIFWVEAKDGPDGIYASRLEGDVLTSPIPLKSEAAVPHFHPAPGIDAQGRPWLVWSSYDGNDYQIYLRNHDGTDWLEPRKLTDVRGVANAHPAAALLHGSIPVVTWLRDNGGFRNILVSYREPGKDWSLPVAIAGETVGLANPAVAAEGGRMAVAWESEGGLHLRVLTLAELQMQTPAPVRKPVAAPYPGLRADDSFIAFGDSITYGILVPPWDIREFGYPPRLQILLETLYANPQVMNRAVPGDDTWGGVSRIVDVVTDDLSLYLLLKLGTNDISSEWHSMITSAFNLSEMTAKCRKHGVFPLLSTVIPRKGDRWNDFTRSRTLNLNNRIRRISREQKVLLVDMYEAFINYPEDRGGWKSLIGDPPDTLHPSLKGYQFMAETWYDHIVRVPFPPVSAEARLMMKNAAAKLTWQPDPKITEITKLSHYKIFRKLKTESDFGEIGAVESSQSAFLDESPEIEGDPIYALKAVALSGLEGPISAPIFPVQGDPYPPNNVAFQTLPNRAFLFTEYINIVKWTENPANTGVFDIALYRIYRKKRGETPDLFRLVGESPVHLREYMDRSFTTVDEANQYVYGVSAVDGRGVEGALNSSDDAVSSFSSPS